MKKSVYIISAANSVSDAFAAEFALTLSEAFPYAEGHCIGGDHLVQAGLKPLARWDEVRDGLRWSLGRWQVGQKLMAKLQESSPKFVALCGFSAFNRKLATICQSQKIPFYLWAPPAFSQWLPKDREIFGPSYQVLGAFAGEQESYEKAGINYKHVGFPCYHRMAKVKINKSQLGFTKDQKIVSIGFQSCPIDLKKILRQLERVGQQLQKHIPDLALMICLPAGALADLENMSLCTDSRGADWKNLGSMVLVENMFAEITAISDLALCCNALDSLQAILLGLPHIRLSAPSKRDLFPIPFVQSISEQLVPEVTWSDLSEKQGIERMVSLLDPGFDRSMVLKGFEKALESIDPFDYAAIIEALSKSLGRKGLSRRARSAR